MFMMEQLQAASSELSEGLWCTLRLYQIARAELAISLSRSVLPSSKLLRHKKIKLRGTYNSSTTGRLEILSWI